MPKLEVRAQKASQVEGFFQTSVRYVYICLPVKIFEKYKWVSVCPGVFV